MKQVHAFILATAALALAVSGCAKDQSAGVATDNTASTNSQTSASTGAPETPERTEAPKYPKNAQWTIRSRSIAGPGHIERSMQLKESVAAGTKLKDWHLLHLEDESVLLYGFYGAIDDKKNRKESERAKKDIAMLGTIADSRGQRPFANGVLWPLTAPDPEAPAEWNLVNAPPGMSYTLEIGVYMNSPQRKQYAVEAVKEARARGITAFYYHGDTRSSVCVGAWPETAIRTTGVDIGGELEPQHPDKPIIVLPPGREAPGNVRAPDGSIVKPVTSKMQILDPTLRQAKQQFPHHEINGEATGSKNKKTGKVVPDESVVMAIPRKTPSILDARMP